MIWKRRPSPNLPERPSDDKIIELLRDGLGEMAPQLVDGCQLTDGMLVGGSQSDDP